MTPELERVRYGVEPTKPPDGLGTVRFLARCQGDAEAVLSTVKSVLAAILELVEQRCADEAVWASTLPKVFVNACPRFPSPEEMEVYRRLPLDERVKLDLAEGWPLRAVMNSFLVLDRWWSWWDAIVLDKDHVAVAVQVAQWPFPWELLRWLFCASGALEMDEEPG